MEEKSDILEQLEQLEKAAAELAHRMHPYMIEPTPQEATDTAAVTRSPRSPVYERITGVTNHLRELSARLVP